MDQDHNQPEPAASLRGLRVLVVDDEETVCRATQLLLIKQGALAEAATQVPEALQMLIQRDFDVIVADLVIPHMDGHRLLSEVRALRPWIGVVVLTGYPEKLDPVRVHLDAMNAGILCKPAAPEEILKAVSVAAANKRRNVSLDNAESAERLHRQIAALKFFCEEALSTENRRESLRKLCEGMGLVTGTSSLALLHIGEDQASLYMYGVMPLAQEHFRALQNEILERFQLLSGKSLSPDQLDIVVEGTPVSEYGSPEVLHTFSVPLLVRNELQGLLVLSKAYQQELEAGEVAFLYHAASQLSTVLIGLNRMHRYATRDTVTGILNRRGLEQELRWLWRQCHRQGEPISVMIMDLDHFKTLNDAHGHLVGDQLLLEATELLRSLIRSSDVLGRYGGDEFVLVLPGIDDKNAEQLASRLLQSFREKIFCPDTYQLRMTLSIGLASAVPLPGGEYVEADTLLSHADQALYQAKRAGRNRVVNWNRSLASTISPTETATEADTPTRESRSILVVDDDPLILNWLEHELSEIGLRVLTTSSAAEALEAARSNTTVEVALVDLLLGTDNCWNLVDVLNELPLPPVIVIMTGHLDKTISVMGARHGVFDYLEKPFTGEELRHTIDRAREHFRLIETNQRYQMQLEDQIRQRSRSLTEALEETRRSYEAILEVLATLLDAREQETARHSVRVSRLAVILAKTMGLSGKELEAIKHGALLHDIGKIALPDKVLLKTGAFTDEDWEFMKKHPLIGYKAISASPFLRAAAEIVYAHQERYDGTGYPRGLKGEEIPLGARIFAVADAYDAMRTKRRYKPSFSASETLSRILAERGKQFDPNVVDALIRCQPEFEEVGQWDQLDTAHPAV